MRGTPGRTSTARRRADALLPPALGADPRAAAQRPYVRNLSGEWRFADRMARACGCWASRRCSTGSFNRHCSKSSHPSSTRPSRTRAMAFDRDEARTRRSGVHASTSRRGLDGWWTWTSRNSSTGSTPTCRWPRVARRVKDTRVLLLIRRYLQAGMMEEGPLSPLLSDILLDEWDRELERRGHRFVRYADDCNVYVRSKAAGERVLASLERWLMQRLRLRVNRDKSGVARPWTRRFLGYGATRDRVVRLRVSPTAV
jgi:hypothetical protein